MRWAMMPLAPVAVAFAAGVAVAPWTTGVTAWIAWAVAVGLSALLLGLGRVRAVSVPLLGGVAALGALRALPAPLPADHVANLPLPRSARVEGRVVREPIRWAPERVRVIVDVERIDGSRRSGRLPLTLYGPPPPMLGEGHRIRVEARVSRASGFRNPGGFDYAAHLAREDIYAVGSAPADRVTVLEAPTPPWPARVRRAAVAAIERALPPASAALLAGLLLGDRQGLPPAIDEAFRRAGVYHVLAVSGFNVALVVSAVWALLRLAGTGHRGAAAAATATVIAFGLVVGLQPSVLRAVIMGGLVLAALGLEREGSVLNSFALAALVILAARPGDLLDPGFQLSFAATGGIVLAPVPRGAVGGALGVSLAAQIAVLPIGLSHFNQLSTIGVVANLAVVPLAGLATVGGLLAVATAFASDTIAAPLFDSVWPVLLALRGVVRLAAAVPGALVHLPAPSWLAIVCYAAGLGGGLAWWRLRAGRPRTARGLGAGALALAAASVVLEAAPMVRPPDGRLRVAVLDVGQGDAIVVQAPDGRVLLVDAGAGGPLRLDTGERVVAPFLWNRGVSSVAVAVVTHSDADHAGGMPAVRRLFAVGESWDRATLDAEPRWLGGVMVSLVHPAARAAAGVRPSPSGPRRPPAATASNAEALVLRLDFGLASFLLASDIGAATEQRLVAAKALLAATVLKVAHHGAATSSSSPFLRAVRPALAVVSVGPRNPYHHPHPATLERLAAVGARTYRTDRDGAVVFETDGRTLTATPTVGAGERYCLDPETIC